MTQIFRADLFHTPRRGSIERIDDALIVLRDGMIEAVLPPGDPDRTAHDGAEITDLRGRGALLPGFVDLHIHAPQFPQLGQSLDVPLEVWLQTHTFPLEARYSDIVYADRVYRALVRTLLANGTTTALYFATIHHESSLRLAEICLEMGQRALVGKVAMDLPGECPDYYRDASPEAAIEGTAAFLEAVPAIRGNSGLVKPVITPRFIPSCSDKVLQALGDMAGESGAHVQTHCSESDWEHGHVLHRCGQSDTAALNDFGLLRRHTVLAHSNLIGEDDMALIAGAGAGVAHCPLSNIYFSNAVFPLRRALEKGLRVGLGTDISGGPSASLFDTTRMAISASRLLEEGVDPTRGPETRGTPESRIDFRTAFWLATMGGADTLDLPVGCFAPGRQFDAMLVALPPDHLVGADLPGDALLQKIVMLATRDSVRATWVAGRKVHDAGG
ncbi:MAG: guanine deaminase [Paracoccaceae bacterium]